MGEHFNNLADTEEKAKAAKTGTYHFYHFCHFYLGSRPLLSEKVALMNLRTG